MKDSNSVSGNKRTTCPLYDEVDAILGNHAASQPATLLDSGEREQNTQADIGILCIFKLSLIFYNNFI